MAFAEDRCRLGARHSQNGLPEAFCLFDCKAPLLQCGDFDLEKGIEISDCHLKRPRWQELGNKLTIVRSHGGREECISSPRLISPLIHVPTDRGDSFPKAWSRGCRVCERRLEQRQALHLLG